MSQTTKINNLANLPEQDVEQLIASVPEEQKEQNYLEIGVRPWGVYYVLEEKYSYKVKKIVVNPKPTKPSAQERALDMCKW